MNLSGLGEGARIARRLEARLQIKPALSRLERFFEERSFNRLFDLLGHRPPHVVKGDIVDPVDEHLPPHFQVSVVFEALEYVRVVLNLDLLLKLPILGLNVDVISRVKHLIDFL